MEMEISGSKAEAILDAKEWGAEVGAETVFVYKGKMGREPMIGYVTVSSGVFKSGIHHSDREYGETGHIRASRS
jgi:hypothetical protein